MVTIDLILPCLDEAQALPWVLSRVPAGMRAIVVDNGSRDGSDVVAREFGATVVYCSERGYGAACRAGVEAASAEFIAICDCDATLDPGEVLGMVRLLEHGADLVIGRRRPTTRAAWPLHARVANRELARRVRRRTGVALTDLGPLRVARREPYLSLKIDDARFGYPVATVVSAAREGWRIVQSDVPYRPRVGDSKVTGTVRGTFAAVRDMSAALR